MSDAPLLTWKGRRVRSPSDSPTSVAKKVPEAPRPGSLFFVPSPLEGWGLDVLLNRLSSDSVVVVLEMDVELRRACETAWKAHLGPLTRDSRLIALGADTETAVQDLFRQLPLSSLRRCEFLTLNGAWMAHGPRYREVFERIDQGLTRWWSNRITCMHMGPLWTKNLLDNLTAPDFHFEPWPTWGTATVLVCGAGVSLEKALPWALAQRQRIKIVAADTALPVLRAWGLTPDAVVCLEAQHANLRDFAGWKDADVMLFTDLTSFPGGTRVFSQPPRWFITEFTELGLWQRFPWSETTVPRLPPLGSVGVAAAWLGWRLTEGPVILAGLDFSYPRGRTHARGAPSLAALAARCDRLHPLEQTRTWTGSGVRETHSGWLTSSVMEGYAGVLKEQGQRHRARTWVWARDGLDLGFEVWNPKRSVAGSAAADLPEPGQDNPLGAWLDGELALWEGILEAFVRINAVPTDEAAWATLEAQLRQVDYLTFSFPDPEFRRDSDWLIRAQSRVRWAIARVNRRR